MNLDEKVGQMNQSSGVVMPMLGGQKPDDLIAQGEVGSILWLIDVKEINRLQHIAVEKSRLHIPILFAYRRNSRVQDRVSRSAGHGVLVGSFEWKKPRNVTPVRTRGPPESCGRSRPWSISLATRAGAASSKAPAKIPTLGAAMARAQVRGFQGETVGPDSVLVCVKHFRRLRGCRGRSRL